MGSGWSPRAAMWPDIPDAGVPPPCSRPRRGVGLTENIPDSNIECHYLLHHPQAMTHMQPAITLPREAYHHLIFTLRQLLPAMSDTPEALARRDRAAVAQVASLCPANPSQALLAAQHVAAHARAMECLRQTTEPGIDPAVAARCTAQAASMMRQSQGALRLLLRAQGLNAARDANDTAANHAAWAEHRAEQWMLGALREDAPDSEIPGQNPADQFIETNSDAAPDDGIAEEPAVADGIGAPMPHVMGHAIMPRCDETKSASPSIGLSHDLEPIPDAWVYETESGIPVDPDERRETALSVAPMSGCQTGAMPWSAARMGTAMAPSRSGITGNRDQPVQSGLHPISPDGIPGPAPGPD